LKRPPQPSSKSLSAREIWAFRGGEGFSNPRYSTDRADGVNILGYNTNTIKKNTRALIDASEDVGLEVNTEKTKYVLMSRHQKAKSYHKESLQVL
jgi:hypothetical protein